MRGLLRLLIGFYPAAWRRRYGLELEALMEDAGWSWRDVPSVFAEAVRLQVTRKDFAICVGGFMAVGLAIAVVLALRIPDTYASAMELHGKSLFGYSEATSRSALLAIIRRYDLYRDDMKRIPLEDVVDRMREKHLHVRLVAPEVLTVTFSHPDPAIARAVVRDVSNWIVLGLRNSTVAILPNPRVTLESGWPDRIQVIAIGLGLGLIGGLSLLWAKRAGFKRSAFIAGSTLTAGVVCYVCSNLIQEKFVSHSTLVVAWPDRYVDAALDHDGIAELRADRHINDDQMGPKELDRTMAQIRRSISVSHEVGQGNRMFVHLAVTWGDKFEARNLNQAVISQINQRAIRALRGTNSLPSEFPVQVVDPPSLPERPVLPWRGLFLWFGLLAGAAFGILFSRNRTPFQPTPRTVTA